MAGLYSSMLYRISGSRQSQRDPMAMYMVHLMKLTAEDQHELQLDPSAIPSPRFKFSHMFQLPLTHSVVYVSVSCARGVIRAQPCRRFEQTSTVA